MDDNKKLLEQFEPKQSTTLATKGQVFAARFTPCGKYVISGGFDSLIHRWDATSEEIKELPPLEGHGGWAQAIAFHPTEQTLFSADSWGQLRCWSYTKEKPKPIWKVEQAHDGWIREVAVSSDGRLLATCGRDQKVCVWSASDGRRLHELTGHGEDVLRVQFHPQTMKIVSGDLKGIVKVWDVVYGKHMQDFDASELHSYQRIQEVGGVRSMAFSLDGKSLFCGGTRPKNGGNVQGVPLVMEFDFETGKRKRTIELGATSDVYANDLQMHPAGFLMATTSGNPGTGKLLFQHLEADKPFYTNTKLANCHAVSLHPDGNRLVVTTTKRGSNGNGRRLDKDGNYIGNTSPIYVFDFPSPADAASG